MYTNIHVHVHLYQYTCTCIPIYMYMYMYIGIHMYICVIYMMFIVVISLDDHNQVKLEPITGRGDCSHTYINASYINVRITSYVN